MFWLNLNIDFVERIIEMKIWHGDSYNKRGEQQLKEFLDYYHQKKGYMLSFCFNKGKTPGVNTVNIEDYLKSDGLTVKSFDNRQTKDLTVFFMQNFDF